MDEARCRIGASRGECVRLALRVVATGVSLTARAPTGLRLSFLGQGQTPSDKDSKEKQQQQQTEQHNGAAHGKPIKDAS